LIFQYVPSFSRSMISFMDCFWCTTWTWTKLFSLTWPVQYEQFQHREWVLGSGYYISGLYVLAATEACCVDSADKEQKRN
jgi:hypothetical protein